MDTRYAFTHSIAPHSNFVVNTAIVTNATKIRLVPQKLETNTQNLLQTVFDYASWTGSAKDGFIE